MHFLVPINQPSYNSDVRKVPTGPLTLVDTDIESSTVQNFDWLIIM